MSYLGTSFHNFWARCGEANIHPDDLAYFHKEDLKTKIPKAPVFETNSYKPCPFDGPLHEARIVICLANPKYTEDVKNLSELLISQRSGEQHLPEYWAHFYEQTFGAEFQPHMGLIRKIASIVNICPYPSNNMDDRAVRFAAGLPSVWEAQKYLREVLIPRARTGNIYLIVLRKHQLWGVNDGLNTGTIKIVRGHELNGRVPRKIASDVLAWLTKKELIKISS